MEEIKNFIYSHSSPNGCVALTRGERDELVIMVEALEEDNLNKQELINDYVFEIGDKDWPINYIDFRHSDLPVSEENILFGEVRIIKQMEK